MITFCKVVVCAYNTVKTNSTAHARVLAFGIETNQSIAFRCVWQYNYQNKHVLIQERICTLQVHRGRSAGGNNAKENPAVREGSARAFDISSACGAALQSRWCARGPLIVTLNVLSSV